MTHRGPFQPQTFCDSGKRSQPESTRTTASPFRVTKPDPAQRGAGSSKGTQAVDGTPLLAGLARFSLCKGALTHKGGRSEQLGWQETKLKQVRWYHDQDLWPVTDLSTHMLRNSVV